MFDATPDGPRERISFLTGAPAPYTSEDDDYGIGYREAIERSIARRIRRHDGCAGKRIWDIWGKTISMAAIVAPKITCNGWNEARPVSCTWRLWECSGESL